MKIIYCNYETNKGLEQTQAEIFNRATKNLWGEPPATAEQILHRYKRENTDPLGVRYAFKDDGQPLAYIQTRSVINPARTYIGYPWAMADCPFKVQVKLFTEMLQYIENRDLALYKNRTIVMGPFFDINEEQIKFALDYEFKPIETETNPIFLFDISDTSQAGQLPYFSRIAEVQDLNRLLSLCYTDLSFMSRFRNEQELISYLRNGLLLQKHTLLLFSKENMPICTGTPFFGLVPDTVVVSLLLVKSGYESALKSLLVAIAKHSVKRGWGSAPMYVRFSKARFSDDEYSTIASELGGVFHCNEVLLGKIIE